MVFRVGDQRRGGGSEAGWGVQFCRTMFMLVKEKKQKVLDGALNSFAGVFSKIDLNG